MQRRPTSFDIAALAGVSQPTVSRALCGSSSVSEATRKRVLEAAEQLNYKVDKNASGLRRQHARTLALLFFEEILDNSRDQSFLYLRSLDRCSSAAARIEDMTCSSRSNSSRRIGMSIMRMRLKGRWDHSPRLR